MPKKFGIIFVAVGAVLILSALSLFLYNKNEDAKAGQKAEELLSEVQTAIVDKDGQLKEEDTSMKVVDIDGYGYIGYISIPSLNVKLPVMADWDYARLKIAPCRQFGSTKTDNLVIAAHNYSTHFGNLSSLKLKDSVIFTDMEDTVSKYEVEEIKTLDPTDVASVQDSGYDLVLYTCTYDGKTRVTVFCNRAD